MNKEINKFIAKKKRAKKIKKAGISTLLIVTVFILVLFKAPFFNVKIIEVKGNKVLSREKIIDSNTVINKNIFYLNMKDIKAQVMLNPYIKNTQIDKKYPDKIIINVEERKATFYLNEGDKFLVLNEELRVMEKKDSLEDMSLMELKGIVIDNAVVGSIVTNDKKKQRICTKLAEQLGKCLENNGNEVKFKDFDIANNLDLKLSTGDIILRIGNDEELKEKLDKAINIINEKNLAFKKGYIDVSFKGNPAIKIE